MNYDVNKIVEKNTLKQTKKEINMNIEMNELNTSNDNTKMNDMKKNNVFIAGAQLSRVVDMVVKTNEDVPFSFEIPYFGNEVITAKKQELIKSCFDYYIDNYDDPCYVDRTLRGLIIPHLKDQPNNIERSITDHLYEQISYIDNNLADLLEKRNDMCFIDIPKIELTDCILKPNQEIKKVFFKFNSFDRKAA